jgi:hypothetical protein
LHKQLGRVIGKALDEGKELFWVVIYFWVLFGLFSVFRSLVLNEQNLVYHEGFAIINAFLLAKVVVTAEFFQVADNLRRKPLVYPIVFKSAVFCILLMCFYFTEETLVGIWHGKTIVESFPKIGGGSWKGVLVVASILFVGLIPFLPIGNSPESSAKTSYTLLCSSAELRLVRTVHNPGGDQLCLNAPERVDCGGEGV